MTRQSIALLLDASRLGLHLQWLSSVNNSHGLPKWQLHVLHLVIRAATMVT